jgi:hypothetical protein
MAETRVGIICISEEGRGPLAVPVWYNYQPGGEVRVWTGMDTRKYKLLQYVQRIGFCVQDPTPPNYKYVSIEGPFTIIPVDLEGDIHAMSLRYYGASIGEQFYADIKNRGSWKEDVMVCITPERWLTVDYSKLGSSSDKE